MMMPVPCVQPRPGEIANVSCDSYVFSKLGCGYTLVHVIGCAEDATSCLQLPCTDVVTHIQQCLENLADPASFDQDS